MNEPYTPFDEPRGLWQRLVFPMLREAWLGGFRAGRRAYPGPGRRQRFPNE